MTSTMKLGASTFVSKRKNNQVASRNTAKSGAPKPGIFVRYYSLTLQQRKNLAQPFTFTGKSEAPITGIAPTGYAGGGLGGPGINLDNVREFLTELDTFEKEFGYAPNKDEQNIDLKHKKHMYTELDSLNSKYYNK